MKSNPIKGIFSASRIVLSQGKAYKLFFIGITLLMFFIFTIIPVVIVSGNTFSTQLSIFTIRDYLLLTFLSLLSALFITMQIYVFRSTDKNTIRGVSKSVSGGFGAIFAGVAGTAFCASCLVPLFAFFGIGFGGVIFVLNYRFYFVIAVILLMLIAIYFTARKINNACTSCKE